EVRPVKPGQGEVRLTQVRPAKVREREVRLEEVRMGEDRPTEVRKFEVCLAEHRRAEVCPAEVRTEEVRPRHVRPPKVRPAEVCPVEGRMTEVYAVGQDVGVLVTPRVPGGHTPPEQCDVLVVRHRKQPGADTDIQWDVGGMQGRSLVVTLRKMADAPSWRGRQRVFRAGLPQGRTLFSAPVPYDVIIRPPVRGRAGIAD